jgi:hypothetical protein
MKIKIIHKSKIIWNLVLFLLFSLFYYHVQLALIDRFSSFNLELFKSILISKSYLVVFVGLSLISIIRVRQYSKVLYLITGYLVIFESFKILLINFDKFLLVLNSFYIILFYYFYQVLKIELSESFYNSNHNDSDMFPPCLVNIECFVEMNDGRSYQGNIINWSEQGMFIKLEEAVPSLDKKIKIIIHFQNEVFYTSTKLISRSGDYRGFGLKVIKSKKSVKEFNWTDLYGILDEMGYEPSVLR